MGDMAGRLTTLSRLLVVILFTVPAISYQSAAPRCSTVSKKENKIIDISLSSDYGAKLMTGVVTVSGAACAARCCQTENCHLAVFNKESVSNHGHNCYLVNCGSNLANCKLAYHHSFVSMNVGISESDAEDDDGWENSHTDSTVTTTTTTTSSSSSSTTSVAPTTTSTEQQPSTSNNVSIPTQQGDKEDKTENDNDSDSTMTRTGGREHELEGNGHERTGDHTSDDNQVTPSTSNDNTNSSSKMAASSPSPNPNRASAQDHTDPDRHHVSVGTSCSNSGCIGTGFIIIGVVGGIVAIVMSLVLLVVAKKIVNSRRRKKFQNVDYLINGMYS